MPARLFLATLTIAVLTTFSPSASAAQAEHFVIMTENWPPFNYLDEKGELTGYCTEIARDELIPVFKLYSQDVSIAFHPDAPKKTVARWQAALDDIKQGTFIQNLQAKYDLQWLQ